MKRRAVIDDVVEQYTKYCSSFSFKLQKGIEGQEIHKEGFVNCYWARDYKLVYMHVDKCGSTSVTTAFNLHCSQFIPLDKLPRAKNPDFLSQYFVESDHTFFAITREPGKRWISGLNEFMCRYRPPVEWVVKQIKNKKYIYDEHTAPQKVFLRLCFEHGGNLKLIKLDGDLTKNVNNFIQKNIQDKNQREKYEPFKIPHLRDSKYFYPNYTSICTYLYENFVFDCEEFKKLYAEDYKLYESGI